MAVGILSIGMMLIATMFPVGIYLTSVASERTMAAIVADEAFAKIQLFGIDPCDNPHTSVDYENELVSKNKIDPCEFSYPPVDPYSDPCLANRQYYWSALYQAQRPHDPNMLYQVTVLWPGRQIRIILTGIILIIRLITPEFFDVNVSAGPSQDKLSVLSGEKKIYQSAGSDT